MTTRLRYLVETFMRETGHDVWTVLHAVCAAAEEQGVDLMEEITTPAPAWRSDGQPPRTSRRA